MADTPTPPIGKALVHATVLVYDGKNSVQDTVVLSHQVPGVKCECGRQCGIIKEYM